MGRKEYLVVVGRYQPAKRKDEGGEGKLKWYDVRPRELPASAIERCNKDNGGRMLRLMCDCCWWVSDEEGTGGWPGGVFTKWSIGCAASPGLALWDAPKGIEPAHCV